MPREHSIAEKATPINFMVICTCGWSFQTTRKQNAWARERDADGHLLSVHPMDRGKGPK